MNSVTIWNDKIILNWDGVLPQNMPKDAYHEPSDVIHFWEKLNGFVRYSKRARVFILNLSKQNLKRIHAQFGQIPVKTGSDKITEIKSKQEAIYNMAQLAEKCKSLPVDSLPTHSYKVSPLGDYQHRGVIYLCNVNRAPLFASCGVGKTNMVLNSTERQIKLGLVKPGKTLICAKLATIETGWLEDAKKFTDLKVTSLWLPQSKHRKEKIIEALNTPSDVYVINHDGVRVFKDALVEKSFEKVVVDESTILKGFHGMSEKIKGGQFGRALLEVSHNASWRVVMSGTPAPNGPQDLWGQFYFLDPDGLFLEPSFSDFQHEFMELLDLRRADKKYRYIDGERIFIPLRPTDPKKWIPKKDSIEKVSKIINPIAYRIRIRDHLKDLPELTTSKRIVEMDSDQKKHYMDMEVKLKVEIDDSRITVPVKVAQLQKLRQITGGFIIDMEEKFHPLPKNPKLDELDSLLEDEIEHNEKVIIYAQYRWEIETIELRYKKFNIVSAYGGNSSKKNLDNIKRFINEPEVRIIVMHPKAYAHGITLTVAHYMIFYSMDHSAEDFYQCVGRIERASQKHPMFVYCILCKRSIDEQIYQVVQTKIKNQGELIDTDQLLIDLWRKA